MESRNKENAKNSQQMSEAINRINVDEFFENDSSVLVTGSMNCYPSVIKIDTGTGISLVDVSVVKPKNIRATKWKPIVTNGSSILILGEANIELYKSGRPTPYKH